MVPPCLKSVIEIEGTSLALGQVVGFESDLDLSDLGHRFESHSDVLAFSYVLL